MHTSAFSTEEQNKARQIEALKKHGIGKWITEKISSKSMDRSQLQAMLDYVREGILSISMTLAVLPEEPRTCWRLWSGYRPRGHLVSDKENLDTGTPNGKLMLTMIAAINEFECQNLLDRQWEGIAKQNGINKVREKESNRTR